MRCAKQVRAAGVGVDWLEGMGDDLDLRDAPGGVCKPGFACMLGDQLGTFRVVGWQLVELGIEALLEEALDRGAESRLAFGGSRDAAVPEAR